MPCDASTEGTRRVLGEHESGDARLAQRRRRSLTVQEHRHQGDIGAKVAAGGNELGGYVRGGGDNGSVEHDDQCVDVR